MGSNLHGFRKDGRIDGVRGLRFGIFFLFLDFYWIYGE